MQWQNIVRQDAYLAGHIAARSYEWWDKMASGPEQTAHSCGLQEGESLYEDFLRGWRDCLDELEIDRLKALHQERERAGENYTKGDPEVW